MIKRDLKFFLWIGVLLLNTSLGVPTLGWCASVWAKGVSMKRLATGQELIVAEDKSLPMCYLYAVIRSGYIWDSPDYEGLTSLMGSMLLRGTTHRTREKIQDELDQLGAEINVEVDAEGLMITGQTLKRNLTPFLDIFSDVILNPVFDAKELAKEKRETVADLKQMRENDRDLVKRFFNRALFGKHPYGMSADGQESTVMRISEKTVKNHYQKLFVRENVFFAASGDLDAKDVEHNLSQHFKSFPKGKVPPFAYSQLKKRKGMYILLVDKPQRTQTQIMLGHPGIDVHHPDYFPLLVANNAFGGGFTSRLMQEVRVKRGWSYGAYSWYNPRKTAGEFGMWVFPASTETIDTLKLVLSMYENYAKSGISAEEFERSKSNLINEYAFKIDTVQKLVSQLITMKILGLPDNYLETYQDNLRAVTLDKAIEALQKQADPKNLTIAIVCTASQLRRGLKNSVKELGKDVEIATKNYKAD